MGRHLLPALEAAFPEAETVLFRADITDHVAVDAEVASCRPDACVHLAGVAAIGDARADPARAWAVNLHGTLALAGSILRHAPSCRMVFASSSDLYGASFRNGLALNEAAILAPLNTYGATKAAADLALGAMASDGLRVVRMRPFNHTGPGQSAAFALPAFARQVVRIEMGLQPPVLKVGDLSPLRDFLDVRDVCAAYAMSLRPANAAVGIYNIASGTARRIGDVLQDLLDAAGVSASVETQGALLRPSDIPLATGDAGAIARDLGWEPRIAWTTTIADVIADWRLRLSKNPQA